LEARNVINRPFLDYALHIMPSVKDGRSVEEVALDARRDPRDKAEIHLFNTIELMGEGKVWSLCRQCIKAAMPGSTQQRLNRVTPSTHELPFLAREHWRKKRFFD
jgi:hypothetical protein